jgi:hypothetical protein
MRFAFFGLLLAVAVSIVAASGAGARAHKLARHDPAPASPASFSYGEPQWDHVGATGCGTNGDGEPAIHVSYANDVFLGSEEGLGGGSDGDIDLAWASAPNDQGAFNLYVASLNGASVAVAHSNDRGTTFANVPVQGGLPLDDREWIAAFGAQTSLLTYHDLGGDIDVLRSDNGGRLYIQISQAIPQSDYRAGDNQHGNLAIDRRNTAGAMSGQFWAYQSYVAPSSAADASGSGNLDEAFVAVSSDGGSTWTQRAIPCSFTSTTSSLDHNFPNVSVDPSGRLWAAWSDDHNVFTAVSANHGSTWTCSGPASTNTAQAIFPWLVATSAGVDLVYYGSPTAPSSGQEQTFYVYFAQSPSATTSGWATPQRLVAVHRGPVCESGIACTGNRQLLDDFGVDTDQSGWAHIAFTSDADANLKLSPGGSNSATGYAVQTGGTPVGFPN